MRKTSDRRPQTLFPNGFGGHEFNWNITESENGYTYEGVDVAGELTRPNIKYAMMSERYTSEEITEYENLHAEHPKSRNLGVKAYLAVKSWIEEIITDELGEPEVGEEFLDYTKYLVEIPEPEAEIETESEENTTDVEDGETVEEGSEVTEDSTESENGTEHTEINAESEELSGGNDVDEDETSGDETETTEDEQTEESDMESELGPDSIEESNEIDNTEDTEEALDENSAPWEAEEQTENGEDTESENETKVSES